MKRLNIAVAVLSIFTAAIVASVASAGETSVKLTKHKESVDVSIGGEPFTTFHFSPDQPKPYFSPVQAPGGLVVTRPLENPEEHPHHKGVWIAVDEVNDIRYWAEAEKIKNFSVETQAAEGGSAKLKIINHWLSKDEKPVLEETTVVTIHPNRLMEFDVTLATSDREVKFEDTKEGLFGIRLTNSMREKEGGRVVNSEGAKGTAETWGLPAEWIDYHGEVDGKTVGVTIMDHPQNFRPSRYHVRNYGLFSISPFGEKAYTRGKEEAKPVVLDVGEKLRLRYALYVHKGDEKEGDAAGVYKQWVK